MILDERTEFADALAVTASAITDVIDLGASPTLRNLGGGKDNLWLVIQVVDAVVASGGASNGTFSLESDSTANLATSATVHWKSAAIPKATLAAGYTVAVIPLPSGQYERYLGVRIAVDTNDWTSGSTFNAFLTNDARKWQAYADAVA